MKRIGFISGVILLFLLTFSCEKEIDLKAQAPPEQLYANAIFNPDSVFRVFISYSVLITAPIEEIHDKLDAATESIVIIRDGNGTLIDTLEFITGVYSDLNNSFLVFESIEGLRPLAEETYELYVHQTDVKNSKTISTSTRLPSFFNPVQASKSSPSRIVTGEDQTFSIELSWEDPDPQEENLFIIEAIYKNSNLPSGAPEFINSELYSINSENDNEEVGPINGKFFYIFIDDDKLNRSIISDTIYTKIGVLTSTFDQWEDLGTPFSSEILIHVHHVSEDLYQYYQDVEKYRINSSGTDIFAQPVSVKGNIQGALGILGAEVIQETRLVYQ